jgi:hypothetical protein
MLHAAAMLHRTEHGLGAARGLRRLGGAVLGRDDGRQAAAHQGIGLPPEQLRRPCVHVDDAVAGVATFEDLTLSQGGTYTLRFRVTRPLATPPVEGISASLTVESVTPRVTSVDVVLSQSSVTGNTAQQAQVRVLDQVGNTMNVPVNWEVTSPLGNNKTP